MFRNIHSTRTTTDATYNWLDPVKKFIGQLGAFHAYQSIQCVELVPNLLTFEYRKTFILILILYCTSLMAGKENKDPTV
ncbi:hypothetical protein Y032_0004g1802 [Ancylostoma ceylanicum]|uniref:Uncharacterized protein n=1 Tax=Ancylostoma ceylanicum TaxID=53326 RepID=A0A016VTB9_9BILA|nr:hypothetical protein Y032_0004g1802 [Ancylostoma ceylanicum]